ncbi:MAG: hypothetical protein WCT24_01355 [Patescibacteria group bacterium]
MKTTTMVFSTVACIVFLGGLVFLSQRTAVVKVAPEENVSMIDGVQWIEIAAKGGYLPRTTVAQAEVPTILRVQTAGTYDCSSSLVIPGIEYAANLPASGNTEIEIPPQPAGSTLQATCGMGMYNFSIQFE